MKKNKVNYIFMSLMLAAAGYVVYASQEHVHQSSYGQRCDEYLLGQYLEGRLYAANASLSSKHGQSILKAGKSIYCH